MARAIRLGLEHVPLVQLDTFGRVVHSPAIEKLLHRVRCYVDVCEHSPMAAVTLATVIPKTLADALREVDAEASHMGQTRPDSRETDPLPNKEVATSVEGGVQTRNPAITRGPGGESPGKALTSVNQERTDRQCKK